MDNNYNVDLILVKLIIHAQYRVCELEFAACDSIWRVTMVRVRVMVLIRLTLTLTLNLPQPLP